MSEYIKYPRTSHLPWSMGRADDDSVLKSTKHFEGKTIIVTEKLDGECTTMYRDYIHARSVDSIDHPSRHYVKAMHAGIKQLILHGTRICGENVYAKHSILYTGLESYFYMFSYWDNEPMNFCFSWDTTEVASKALGIPLVPVLYYGSWNEDEVKACYTGISKVGGEQEGYVVRLADSFGYEDFDKYVAKFVREGHVQTDEHWMHKEVIPNRLKE